MKAIRLAAATLLFFTCVSISHAQTSFHSEQPGSLRWTIELSPDRYVGDPQDFDLFMEGVSRSWQNTADPQIFDYVKMAVDDSRIQRGNQFLMLYGVTGEAKYYERAVKLRQQIKDKAPGSCYELYMNGPFLAQYAAMFHEPNDFDDVAQWFVDIGISSRNAKVHLSSKSAAREYGWYLMALVDALPYFPETHPRRAELIRVFRRTIETVEQARDPKALAWYTALKKHGGKNNDLDVPASHMFAYAAIRGTRLGYLDALHLSFALGSCVGKDFLQAHRPVHAPALLMANTERNLAWSALHGYGKTVLLDSWFNNETRKDITGTPVIFHYKWNEMSMPGYWFLGNVFRAHGVQTKELFVAPTAENLKQADIYMIVNPDNTAKIAQPNYMDDASVKAITEWVKAGGVLVMMENNKGNSDFEHFNKLSEAFGIHFNEVTRNTVEGDKFEQAKIMVAADNPILKKARQIYMKEISTITPKPPAKAILEDKGDVLMAVSHLGKGTVLAVVDPWLYNEYVDGRRLPPEYQNFTAAQDLVRWLLEQLPKK